MYHYFLVTCITKYVLFSRGLTDNVLQVIGLLNHNVIVRNNEDILNVKIETLLSIGQMLY